MTPLSVNALNDGSVPAAEVPDTRMRQAEAGACIRGVMDYDERGD
jgi:hypothetical protein